MGAFFVPITEKTGVVPTRRLRQRISITCREWLVIRLRRSTSRRFDAGGAPRSSHSVTVALSKDWPRKPTLGSDITTCTHAG